MDQVVLLDTHVLLWATYQPAKLSRAASRSLERASRRLLADISLREISAIHSRGQITFTAPLERSLDDALEAFDIEVVPISTRIAARSVNVAQNFRGDPADQLIAATAIELNVPLVTADQRLRASPALRTIW